VNWDAVGAISEIIGAAGVMASLIYLATQIRQNTRTERARAFQNIFSETTALTNEMFSVENSDLMIAGMRNFKALSGGDQLRFDYLMLGYFNTVESTIFAKDAFLISDETLDNFGYSLRTRFLPYPGVRDWWSEAQAIFASETRAWVDQQISRTDTTSDLFGIK